MTLPKRQADSPPGAADSRLSTPPLASVTPLTSGQAGVISALPVEQDLELYQGDDFPLAVTVNNPDGSPANLTGATALAQIRATASLTSPVLATFTATISGNVISLHLTSAMSTNLPPSCVYDCQMTDVSANVTTLIAGKITVTPQVSQ